MVNLNHNKFIFTSEIIIIFHFELQKDTVFQKMEKLEVFSLNPCRTRRTMATLP